MSNIDSSESVDEERNYSSSCTSLSFLSTCHSMQRAKHRKKHTSTTMTVTEKAKVGEIRGFVSLQLACLLACLFEDEEIEPV
mmetsp:Transcript_92542/g.193480  ORF Transcript_92542/g.193480 Transcript_92542/m.193480 type:complete len:82 (+) Transcript_92542:205-450(+)